MRPVLHQARLAYTSTQTVLLQDTVLVDQARMEKVLLAAMITIVAVGIVASTSRTSVLHRHVKKQARSTYKVRSPTYIDPSVLNSWYPTASKTGIKMSDLVATIALQMNSNTGKWRGTRASRTVRRWIARVPAG